jgi:hypothetical protein
LHSGKDGDISRKQWVSAVESNFAENPIRSGHWSCGVGVLENAVMFFMSLPRMSRMFFPVPEKGCTRSYA